MESQALVREKSGRVRDSVRIVTVAIAYFLANRLALLFPDSHLVLAALWPAGGIGLAALLLSPRRLWPALLAAIFVAGNAADLIAGRHFLLGFGFMIANVVESFACAWWIRWWCGADVRFVRVREVVALVAAATIVNAGSAVIGAGAAVFTGVSPFGSFWFTWWIADGLGIMLIAPLIVTWSDYGDLFLGLQWRRAGEAAALMALLTVAGLSAFRSTPTVHGVLPRPYMVIGILAWCGLRFGQRTVTLVLMVLATIAVTTGAVNLGPFLGTGETPQERLLTVQIYLAFISASGLLLAAAYDEAKSAEARVRVLGDNLPRGAVYQVMRERDGSKRFLYLSAGIEKLTGVSPEEILRDSSVLYSMLLEEDVPAYLAAEQEAVRNRGVFQAVYRLRRRDGQIRWIHATSSPRPLGDGRIVWDGIQTDITERKQAEDDLRYSEERFRTLIEDAPIAIATVPRDGRMAYANPAWFRMFGFEGLPGLEGRSIYDFFAPACRDAIEQRTGRRWQGLPEPREYESVGARRDGSEFPMLVAVTTMEFGEDPAQVVFITDLTVARQSEEARARLEQQLRQAQKLESIGRLAGGVAHDFNNLLTVINGFSSLLTQRLESQGKLWTYADQIRKSGERAAALTRQLLAFSRQEAIKPVALNLNRIIADSEQMVQRLIGSHISFSIRLDPALGQVLADPAQIDQIVLNLAANARDAMPGGGRLEIVTRNVESPANGTPGQWISVTVTDTGIGMDEATQARIFEPFFTTKGVGKGTGLGLATVYGVMQQNGGWIDVQSTQGAGTSFALYFPRIDVQALPAPAELAVQEAAHGGERILLVEDENAVRDFVRAVLEDNGYQVLEARDGADAVGVWAERRDDIHLLLTDVVMPVMNGRELAGRLRQERPALKVIFLSGYAADLSCDSVLLSSEVAYVQKPVSPEALAAKVREVLNGSAIEPI